MDAAALRAAVGGTVFAPGDPGWDDARFCEAGLGSPDLLLRASSVDDVREAVRFARASGLGVTVRGGGHSAWSTLEGGLMVDLSGLDDVQVVRDGGPGARVRVGGGARWGAVADRLAGEALAISSGDTRSVGVGGLTLGGGIGWMVRAWGLAADQLEAVELVTADGGAVEVDAQSQPELWWALRGGGGNFGVVTRFDFRAHDLPGIAWAELAVDGDPRPVLATLRDVLAHAPRSLTVTYMDVPEVDPNAPAGKTITAVWAAADDRALRRTLSPVLALPGVTERALELRPYPDVLLDGPPVDPDQPLPGLIGGNGLVIDLDDEYIDGIASFRESTPLSIVLLRSLGGAFGDVADADSVFPARGASWFAMAAAFDIPGLMDDARRDDLAAAWAPLDARGAGVYGNFAPSADRGLAARMYPSSTMARLIQVKRRWDPENVFSGNHNVVP